MPGDACLDIGANVGFFAASFANCVKSQGYVVAVEPGPDTCAALRTTLQTLRVDQVHVEEAAVSNETGEVTFMVARDAAMDATASMKVSADQSDAFRPHRVPAVTIDSLVEKHGIAGKLAVLKIDIEGAEPLALAGATHLLDPEHLPLCLIEIHRIALSNFGHVPENIWRFFPQDQFDLYHAHRSTGDLTPAFVHGQLYRLTDPAAHPWPWYSNMLAVPRVGKYASRRSRIATLLPQ